jgi:hypothetical protein
METLKVGLFSKMKFCLVVAAAAVSVCLWVGCTSVPQIVKSTGGEPLEQCPQELDPDTGERSVALISIETDLLFDEFYLLLEKDDGAKFLMALRPRKFGMPSSENVAGRSRFSRFKAKPFCYDIPPGNYHITKVIGVFRSSGPAGMREENVEYNHTREFNAPLNRVIYLGRYIFLDPRMKDKGTFGRMGKMMSGMVTGSILPNDIEINIADSIDEDAAWMLEEHKQIRIEQVIKAVR